MAVNRLFSRNVNKVKSINKIQSVNKVQSIRYKLNRREIIPGVLQGVPILAIAFHFIEKAA